jgi:hypothetical protein
MVLIVDSTRLVAHIYHLTLCQLIQHSCLNFAVDRVPHQDLHLRTEHVSVLTERPDGI